MFNDFLRRAWPLKTACVTGLLLAAQITPVVAQDAPILQPGAPGEATRSLDADEAVAIANSSYTPADARFMTDMIPHHHQALVMSRLAPERTNNPEILDLAGRIDGSQADEIAFMQDWLRERGEPVPDPTAHHAMHTHHDMAGMASPEQMANLENNNHNNSNILLLLLLLLYTLLTQ